MVKNKKKIWLYIKMLLVLIFTYNAFANSKDDFHLFMNSVVAFIFTVGFFMDLYDYNHEKKARND
jgi:predicted tellurium resistance membrane protein TerC